MIDIEIETASCSLMINGDWVMRYSVVAALALAVSAPAKAQDDLPVGIAIISATEAADCQFIDIVEAMRWAITSGASRTQRRALIAALERGLEAGGNAAVINSITASNNQQQVALGIYDCSASQTSEEQLAALPFEERLQTLFQESSQTGTPAYAIVKDAVVGQSWVATVHGYRDNQEACMSIIAVFVTSNDASPLAGNFSCEILAAP